MATFKTSQLPPTTITPTGLERVSVTAGGGTVQLPLFAIHSAPNGELFALMRPYLADVASQTPADPGAGFVRWNDGVQIDATQIFINHTDGDAGSIAAALAALTEDSILYLQAAGENGIGDWQKWRVLGTTPATGWTSIAVELIASGGSMVGGEEVLVSLQGPPGAAGGGAAGPDVVTEITITGGVLEVDLDGGAKRAFTVLMDDEATLEVIGLPAGGLRAEFDLYLKQDAMGGNAIELPASFQAIGYRNPAMDPPGDSFIGGIPEEGTYVMRASTVDGGTTWVYEVLRQAMPEPVYLDMLIVEDGAEFHGYFNEQAPDTTGPNNGNAGGTYAYSGTLLQDTAALFYNGVGSCEIAGIDGRISWDGITPLASMTIGVVARIVDTIGRHPLVTRDDPTDTDPRFFDFRVDGPNLQFESMIVGSEVLVSQPHGLIGESIALFTAVYNEPNGTITLYVNGEALDLPETIGSGLDFGAAGATPVVFGNYHTDDAGVAGDAFTEGFVTPGTVASFRMAQYGAAFLEGSGP